MEYSERVKFIEYKGKEICFFDFSGLRGDEHHWVMEIGFEKLNKNPPKEILYLSYVRETRLTITSKKKAQELMGIAKSRGIKIKGATVGLTGIQKLIASTINSEGFFTNDIEEAKDWLVSDDE